MSDKFRWTAFSTQNTTRQNYLAKTTPVNVIRLEKSKGETVDLLFAMEGGNQCFRLSPADVVSLRDMLNEAMEGR